MPSNRNEKVVPKEPAQSAWMHKGYGTQLLVWCLILAFAITWHQHWSSYNGYLSDTESNTTCVHWCIKFTLGVHHSTWLTLYNQSLNPVVDPVWGPPTLLTTSNIALELNSVNGALVTLVQLPGIIYLTEFSLPLTLTDFLNDFLTRGQSNLTKSASRGAHSPVRGHPRRSKVVPLNSWGRVSY